MAASHSRVLRALERLFMLGGFVALGWCAVVVTEARVTQRRALDTLARSVPSIPSTALAIDAEIPSPAPIPPPRGTPLAELEIPRLHLAEGVLEGADETTLRRGPGHIEHTSWPGESGNVGIAGHRDTFFRALHDVHIGDDIVLSRAGRDVRYRVSSLLMVPPDDIHVLDATAVPSLTLITCYPFWFVGPAPLRYVVRAVRLDADDCKACSLRTVSTR